MRRFLAGLIVGAVVASAITVGAVEQAVRLVVNGKEVVSDVPPQIINGRTLVPARGLAEALGATVKWDAPSRAVLVESAGQAPAATFVGVVNVGGASLSAPLSYNEAGSVCVPTRTISEFARVESPRDVPRDTLVIVVDGVRLTSVDLWTYQGRSFVCADTMTNTLKWQVAWDKASSTMYLVK